MHEAANGAGLGGPRACWASESLAEWLFPAGARDGGGVGVAFAHVTEEARELHMDVPFVRTSGREPFRSTNYTFIYVFCFNFGRSLF